MSTHKRIDAVCIAGVFLSVVLAVLLMSGKMSAVVPAANGGTDSGMFTAGDLEDDWDISKATRIELSDQGSAISGNGAYLYDGNVCIAYGGSYVLTGELTDGSVVIDAEKTDKIRILLDGVTIHSEGDAAIRVEQADKVFLTLAEDTENVISSGAQYTEEISDAGVDGTIYSRDDLTINGSGILTVDAAFQHGIVCNDDLVFAGGDIRVEAVQDGIHANDSVRVRDAVISVSAGDDGITVSNDDGTAFFYMESGSISIPACYEGIEAAEVTIAGGNIDIVPTDDGINAAGSGGNAVIRIAGGGIVIVNPTGRDADGLDSNGDIYIEGGKVFVSVSDNGGNCAIDYGSENGGECIVSGGTVVACGGSFMAEGFDKDSPQGFVMYHTTADAGTVVTLKDASGRELLSEEIPCSFSSVVLSAPGLTVGDVCTVAAGETQEQITIDNVADSGAVPAGMFGGGMRGMGEHGGMADGRGSGDMGRPMGDTGFSGERGRPEGMEFPGGDDLPDEENRPEMPGGEEGQSAPEEAEVQEGQRMPEGREGQERPEMPESQERPGMQKGQRMQDGLETQGNIQASNISADTLMLFGISVLILAVGLAVAVKFKA